jgi:hypothetical protein
MQPAALHHGDDAVLPQPAVPQLRDAGHLGDGRGWAVGVHGLRARHLVRGALHQPGASRAVYLPGRWSRRRHCHARGVSPRAPHAPGRRHGGVASGVRHRARRRQHQHHLADELHRVRARVHHRHPRRELVLHLRQRRYHLRLPHTDGRVGTFLLLLKISFLAFCLFLNFLLSFLLPLASFL